MSLGVTFTLLALASSPGQPPEPSRSTACEQVVSLLQYLQTEYPEAVEYGVAADLEEQRQVVGYLVDLGARLSPRTQRQLKALEPIVRGGDRERQLQARAGALIRALVAECRIPQAPSERPDLRRGAHLFSVACASCHGKDGTGESPAALDLEPPPANFHSVERMDALTPFRAYLATTHGIPVSAMPAFDLALTESDRWAVTFYLFTLRFPPCAAPANLPVGELARSSDAQLMERYGDLNLGCLRALSSPGPERPAATR